METRVKIISDKRRLEAILAAGSTCLLAAGFAFAPSFAQDNQDSSLDEMWQEHQKDLQPSGARGATSKETKGKKEKRSRKNKSKGSVSSEEAELNKLPPGSQPSLSEPLAGAGKTTESASSGKSVKESGINNDEVSSGISHPPASDAARTSTTGQTNDTVPSSSVPGSSPSLTRTPAVQSSPSAPPPAGSHPQDFGLGNTSESIGTENSRPGKMRPQATSAGSAHSGSTVENAGTETPTTRGSGIEATAGSGRTETTPTRAGRTETKTGSSRTGTAAGSGRTEIPTTGSSVIETTAGSSGTETTLSEDSRTENLTSAQEPGAAKQALCTLSTLTTSDFVKTGGWPGVGPFTPGQGKETDLVDESKNRLHLKVSGDQVTHAELNVVNQTTKPSQLLALQMTTDFFLEALGAQSGRIADFNSALEKNHDKLIPSSKQVSAEGKVSLKAGNYLVNIERQQPGEDTIPGNESYVISVDNEKPLSASRTAVVAASPIVSSSPASDEKPSGDLSFTIRTTAGSQPPAKIATISGVGSGVQSSGTRSVSPSQDDVLRKQFINLIEGWQRIKRIAMKSRQTVNLTRILGGKALETQNKALKWLNDNHYYYEMTPIDLNVQSYKAVVPQVKYEVTCTIEERQQLMKDDTLKPAKDPMERSYKVVYTVEKVRGAWLITNCAY